MSDRGTGGSRDGERPWYESLPDGRSWAALWSGYVRCACGAIWSMEAECPVCGEAPPKEEWVVVRDTDGTEYRVPPAFNGAEGRYEDWIYLGMLEREWLKPVDADLYESIPDDRRPSAQPLVARLATDPETATQRRDIRSRLFRQHHKLQTQVHNRHLRPRHRTAPSPNNPWLNVSPMSPNRCYLCLKSIHGQAGGYSDGCRRRDRLCLSR